MQANRPLFQALLFSVGAHLLLAWPQVEQARLRSPPLTAHLTPVVQPPVAKAVERANVLEPPILGAPSRRQSRSLPPVASAAPSASPAPLPPVHVSAQETPAPATQRTPSPAPVGLDAEAVRGLRLALAGALQGLGQSRFLAQNGTMHVYAQWLPGGVFARATIVQSSGSTALDAEVLAAINQAARQLTLSQRLQGSAFGLELTLAF